MAQKSTTRVPESAAREALSAVLARASKTIIEGPPFSEDYFAERLFAKAPAAFLVGMPTDELYAIVRRGYAALAEYLTETEGILVRRLRDGDRPGFFVAMRDCPFIISSMIEQARFLKLGINVILHPILPCGGLQVAFSYLELNCLMEDVPADFENTLCGVLKDVALVTGDFAAVAAEAGRLKEQFSGDSADESEIAAFLDWLEKGSFLFLGMADWDGEDGKGKQPKDLRGLLKPENARRSELLSECVADVDAFKKMDERIWISRLNVRSRVQRRTRMHHILIRSGNGKKRHVYSILGVFTYAAHAGTCSEFPIIRRKFEELVQLENVVPNSHDWKHLVESIDRMPLDDALSLDIGTLRRIVHMTQGVHNTADTRVLVHSSIPRRTVIVLVVMGREMYTAEVSRRLRAYLENLSGAEEGIGEYHIDTSLNPFARVYFQLPVDPKASGEFDEEKIESDIQEISRSWVEGVELEIARLESDRQNAERLLRRYRGAFPPAYQALHSPSECMRDISQLERLDSRNPILAALYSQPGGFDMLAIYRLGTELILSKMLPVVEAAGLEVLHAEGMEITPKEWREQCFIYRLKVRGKDRTEIAQGVIEECFCPGLVSVLMGEYESDVLNSLMLSSGLSARQIALLRTYCSHLIQLKRYSSTTMVLEAFSSLPRAARLFWECFDIRFSPDFNGDRRAGSAAKLEEYRLLLKEVTDLTRDRIHKGLLNLLEHTVRTNYFHFTPAIAIKVESRFCEVMPLPRPHVEIFVRSSGFEGVHLRGGPVSRGGLRWSERPGDYRNEILGLMKTQRVKNVLIAPDGAKGGFIVRNLPAAHDEIQKRVVSSYEDYIRALLSVTDNRVNGKVVTPARVVAWDSEDPYLVVAADKGTASFSDIANRIAVEEYDFWLGDAFASGGSKGYSHKALGITAKGAWQCVLRLFHDLGIEPEKAGFTAVGIGDMGGDVFGNGMIITPAVKLIAAFNHSHIFIDPAPDPEKSFEERKRLFDLPRSAWSDYNVKLISKGGGIFPRLAKEIKVTKEMREALGLPDDAPPVVDGERIISWILKAPVDLLWNGGIGTYVKSRSESHSDVNDGANDAVRIDADELRCRVVGEGGNLGFTQRARIEFALRGGKINTDAIDNSAGVDMSDHEVNLKILFSGAIHTGSLEREDRDTVLQSLADEVTASVLSHNRSHARSLSLAERRSAKQIDFYSPMLTFLHKQGFINREIEALPDDEDLKERKRLHVGLTRPELAVLMAGAKMWLKKLVVDGSIPEDESFRRELLSYFPLSLRERFRDEILRHPLAPNILSLQVVNEVVDLFGMSFVYRLSQAEGVSAEDVLRCCCAAQRLVKGKELAEHLLRIDDAEKSQVFLKARSELGHALRTAAAWYLHYLRDDSVVELESVFSESRAGLMEAMWEVLDTGEQARAYESLSSFTRAGLDDDVSKTLALLPWMRETLQMLWATHLAECSLSDAARVFRASLRALELHPVFEGRDYIQFKDQWEYELFNLSVNEIWKSVTLVVARLLKSGVRTDEDVASAILRLRNTEDIQQAVRSAQDKTLSVSGVAVLSRKIVEACGVSE